MNTLLLPLLLLACPDPTKDKAPAVVTEAVAPPAPAPALPAAAAPTDAPWRAATGTVGFQAAKVTKTHDGTFGDATLSAQFTAGALSAIKAEVKVASLKTDAAKLDAHLQSPDFFDVAAMPLATFQSTAIRAGAPAGSPLVGATHTLEGDLSIHGVTKHITVPAVITTVPGGVQASTEFSIQRQDFGISYPGKPDDLIADGVLIRVTMSASDAG